MNPVITALPINEIHADWSWNCRREEVRPLDVVELMNSIRDQGLLQPVVVVEYPEWKENPKPEQYKYLLVIGYRRMKAHVCLERETIAATIRAGAITEAEAIKLNMVENLQRKDLTLTQEVEAVKQLKLLGLNRERIAAELGMSPGWAQTRTMLALLPKFVTEEVQDKKISTGHVLRLYTLYQNREERSGIDAAYETLLEAVKQLKKDKSSGLKKASKYSEAPATRKQIFRMQEIIFNNLGAGFATRLLAWCAGKIGEEELLEDLKEECAASNRVYVGVEDDK